MNRILILLTLIAAGWTGNANAQVRTDLMFCGSSSRTGANLYQGVAGLSEVSSCTPTSTTQAMLVTRSGSGSISGNGAAWLAYLNGGGIIITEYNNSHLVYNELYGTAYALASPRDGDCYDNVMPTTIINPGHPFWVANPLTETPDNQESCGYDVSAIVDGEPSVTALGAWASGSISLAYRTQGSGVLVLAPADWQDTDTGYTDDSRNLMGALIDPIPQLRGAAAPVAGPAEPVPTLSQWALTLLVMLMALFGLYGVRRQLQ